MRHLPLIRSWDAGQVTRLPAFRRYVPRDGHPDWARLAQEADEIIRSVGPGLVRPKLGRELGQRRRAALRTAFANLAKNSGRHLSGREDLLPL